MTATPLDRTWLTAHPLPDHPEGTDKNGRGRVIAVGGSRLVPGALRLTGEAALRVGAGRIRLATIADAAMILGVAFPEAAIIALPADDEGEIDAVSADRLLALARQCDALVLGPGMADRDAATPLVTALLDKPIENVSVVLDAAAVACAAGCARIMRHWAGRVVLTPHHGEMARLTGLDEQAIASDPEPSARNVAERLGATIALKGAETVIASPDGVTLRYRGGTVGLATGGSGDVLAGIIGGLLAQGAPPLTAVAWGVHLHGEAGMALSQRSGPTGFLARELLPEIPRLMR